VNRAKGSGTTKCDFDNDRFALFFLSYFPALPLVRSPLTSLSLSLPLSFLRRVEIYKMKYEIMVRALWLAEGTGAPISTPPCAYVPLQNCTHNYMYIYVCMCVYTHVLYIYITHTRTQVRARARIHYVFTFIYYISIYLSKKCVVAPRVYVRCARHMRDIHFALNFFILVANILRSY